MNEPSPQYLVIGLEVAYIGADHKSHKAKITEVFNQREARVESNDGQNTAIAAYSETNEINTFHFPSSGTASPGKEKK